VVAYPAHCEVSAAGNPSEYVGAPRPAARNRAHSLPEDAEASSSRPAHMKDPIKVPLLPAEVATVRGVLLDARLDAARCPDWPRLHTVVQHGRFKGANEEFHVLSRWAAGASSEEIDAEAAHAAAAWAFLVGFGEIKSLYRARVSKVVRTLIARPGWHAAYAASPALRAHVGGLHADLQAAFHLEGPRPAAPEPRAEGAAAQVADDNEDYIAVGRPSEIVDAETVNCETRSQAGISDLDHAAESLRQFMQSAEGQDLIFRTYECYQYIHKMSEFCRSRSRFGHGSVTVTTALAGAGAAGTVAVGGIIFCASGGAIAPAVATAIGVGLYAGAISGAVELINALSSFGFDAFQAKLVKNHIEKLSGCIAVWDEKIQAVLEAAEHLAEGPHKMEQAVEHIVGAVGQASITASWIHGIMQAIIRANTADTTSLIAPSVLGGAVSAGSTIAASLMLGLSGVSLISNLVTTVLAGIHVYKGGYCDAADNLGAHADRFCAMLHMMSETAQGTRAHKYLVGQLPDLLFVEVEGCLVPPANYRLFDKSAQVLSGAMDYGQAYFQLAVGSRRRDTGEALSRVAVNGWTTLRRAVLLRLLPDDPREVWIQCFDKRGVQRVLRGDPPMGRPLRLDIREQAQKSVKLVSGRDRAELEVSYQVIRTAHGGADDGGPRRPAALAPRRRRGASAEPAPRKWST